MKFLIVGRSLYKICLTSTNFMLGSLQSTATTRILQQIHSVTSRNMRLSGHAVRMGVINAYTILFRKPEGTTYMCIGHEIKNNLKCNVCEGMGCMCIV
jgi:hypothetical protein